MKSGYLVTGIRFRKLLRLMVENNFNLAPKTLFRFLMLLQNSLWSSFFTRREGLVYGDYYRNHPLPLDPVFIVGHWRTGSTYLHKLMSLDPQLAAPTLYQTSLPEGFVTARPYYAPIMKRMIGKFRPFDNMKAGIDEPQECEFALFRICGESPLKKLMFPDSSQYFLLQPDLSFFPSGKRATQWEQALESFYTKLSWYSKKRLVLKNPFHSMRISYLSKKFPQARFIHIHRDPLEVIPSTIRMWSVVGSQNVMNGHGKPPQIKEVATFYNIMMQEIEQQMSLLPASQKVEINYRELVEAPMLTLQKTYAAIGLDFSSEYQQCLTSFLDTNRDYEKNNYSLTDHDKQEILTALTASAANATRVATA